MGLFCPNRSFQHIALNAKAKSFSEGEFSTFFAENRTHVSFVGLPSSDYWHFVLSGWKALPWTLAYKVCGAV